jgi:hypothetical protein
MDSPCGTFCGAMGVYRCGETFPQLFRKSWPRKHEKAVGVGDGPIRRKNAPIAEPQTTAEIQLTPDQPSTPERGDA